MAADLTGLVPYRDYSRKLLEEAFPGGGAGVPDEELSRTIREQLWGTPTKRGIYSEFAGKGIAPSQPPLWKATEQLSAETVNRLKNEYQRRQLGALTASRTAELTDPAFRISEAGVTGYYDGGTTLAREEAEARQQEAAEMRKRLDMMMLGQGIGSLLNWLSPPGSRGGGGLLGGGTGIGGGNDFGIMNLTGIPALYSFLTGNKFPGVIPTVKSGWESIFGGGGPGPTPTVPDTSPVNWAWDEMSQSFIPTAEAGAGGSAAMDALSTGGNAVGGVSTAVTAYNYLTSMGVPAAQAAEIAASTQAAAIAELAAMGGPAATGAGAGAAALSGVLEATGPGVAAASGAPYAFGPGAGASAGMAAPLGMWTGPAMVATAFIPAIIDLLTNKEGAVEDAQAAYQQQRLLGDAGLREDAIRRAAAGDFRGADIAIISAIENWPNDGSGFKERFFRAMRHEGEFAGMPSPSPPVWNPQMEQYKLNTGFDVTPAQWAWMNQPDTGR